MRGPRNPETLVRAALTRAVRRAVWAIALSGVALLLVRAFVGDVYYVDSRSMAPTLHGGPRDGEFVWVRFERRPALRRFDLVVLQRPGDAAPLVKRVAGLGGETLQLAAGDLFVGGKLLQPHAPRPAWVELFDSAKAPLEQHFSVAHPGSRWTRAPDGWRLDVLGGRPAAAELIPRALDDYFDRYGERVNGRRQVGDLALEIEFALDGPWGDVRLRLTEEGDRFDLVLTPAADSGHILARLERRSAPRFAAEVLAQSELAFPDARSHRVLFSNIDNCLRVDLDGSPAALEHSYAENAAMWGLETGFQHQLPRAAFGGAELRLAVSRVRLWRDVSWVDLGRHAVDRPLVLAPDELFVLGDNSAESLDSREWGPALREWVVGRPLAVVWPPSRWRLLTAPADESSTAFR